MDEEKEETIIMECPLNYYLSDENGREIASGDAQVRLGEENISILPKFGEVLFISYRDIFEVSDKDYKIYLALSSGEKLILSNLGYKYEDFLRYLSKLRNEMLLKDMLMQETLKKSGVEAEFIYYDENEAELQKGKCEPRLYETAMVIIPERGEIFRIPYSSLSKINEEDYALSLEMESGRKLIISRVGAQFTSFTTTLSRLINELSVKVQSSLKELLPHADPLVLRQAARFMKEGRAARRSDIESISPELWKEMENKLDVMGLKEEYNFLKSLSQKEKICIGLKRGLLGDLTGEYIWFLIPIYDTDAKKPGNAIALEAASGEDGGKATYFFRLVSRKEYPNFENMEDLHHEADNFIKKVNRCMLAINFRREPIYLPDEKLDDSRYQKYKFAIAKIPELKLLRELFIGRVIHSSYEQWKNDVMDLLEFNVKAQDDNAKWKKGEING